MIPTKRPLIEKTCPVCRGPFSTYDRRQLYCSRYCQHRIANQRFWSKRKIIKTQE